METENLIFYQENDTRPPQRGYVNSINKIRRPVVLRTMRMDSLDPVDFGPKISKDYRCLSVVS